MVIMFAHKVMQMVLILDVIVFHGIMDNLGTQDMVCGIDHIDGLIDGLDEDDTDDDTDEGTTLNNSYHSHHQ